MDHNIYCEYQDDNQNSKKISQVLNYGSLLFFLFHNKISKFLLKYVEVNIV